MEDPMVKLGSLIFLFVAGCAHESGTRSTSAKIDDGFSSAYESVASGARTTAKGGGYLIEKAGNATVRVLREIPVGGVGRDVSDGWISAKVNTRLKMDKDVNGGRIDVETDAGMVTLRGTVESKYEAMKAIRDTLDIDGVTAVNSQLQWPDEQRAKIYQGSDLPTTF
jgi:hypothetical protein